MNDFYTEQLVKKKSPVSDIFVKAGLIIVTILSFFIIFKFPFAIIAPIVMILLDVVMFKRLNVEYEYLYVNGDLDIDKIMAKSKRKRILGINIADLELIAPSGSAEVRLYQNIKPCNYSSRESNHKTYEMIVLKNGEKKRIIFEPNQTILEGIRMLAPRKVVL
ncbi:DUF6106 family protein [Lachnospiraceae bacterium LCP25S3_G4]